MKALLTPLVVTLLVLASFSAIVSAAEFAGLPIAPGATVRAEVPLNDLQKRYVTEGGNPVPPHAVAVLAVPPGFDPQKSWPVLVVFSTSDFKHQNRDDLVNLYRATGLAEGWVLIAGDGPEPARQDSSGWRLGTTLAALDALHRSFPRSKNWPVACAGFSGGAKRAGLLSPLLAMAGHRLAGVFLTGLNDDTLSQGYAKYKPGSSFLQTRVFLSSGVNDRIAPLQQQNSVKLSMQRNGFSNVRHETFAGGHGVKRTHVVAALRWFRQ